MQNPFEATLAFLKTPEGQSAARAVQEQNEAIRKAFEVVISEHWNSYQEALQMSLGSLDQVVQPGQMLSYIMAAFIIALRPKIEELLKPSCFHELLEAQANAIELGGALAMHKQGAQERERIAAMQETKH